VVIALRRLSVKEGEEGEEGEELFALQVMMASKGVVIALRRLSVKEGEEGEEGEEWESVVYRIQDT